MGSAWMHADMNARCLGAHMDAKCDAFRVWKSHVDVIPIRSAHCLYLAAGRGFVRVSAIISFVRRYSRRMVPDSIHSQM